ncbi:MAG TPA: hypothetical protein VES66_01930 [Terriglobales bacterium]|nr:hypothetical protein [Terriglobales bacterium]
MPSPALAFLRSAAPVESLGYRLLAGEPPGAEWLVPVGQKSSPQRKEKLKMTTNHYLALLWLFLSLVPCAFSQREGQDRHALAKFQNALKQDGFDVTPGAAVAWNLAAQWCAYDPTVPNAGYSNNEPYVVVLAPKSVQEPGQLTTDFKLGPDEAVVLIGLTPPPARYFSYTPYLSTRVYPDGRKQILASLGDAVNIATVKTIGSTPFNSPVALIFAPDHTTEAHVRRALQSAGYPAAIINTVVFPASMLNLGQGQTADELRIGLRNAIWQDSTAGDSYIKNPPLNVFRVTPRTPATANPFPAPRLRIRGTGHTEMELMNKLGQLRQGILTANSGLHATDIVPMPMCNEGYDLIQRGPVEALRIERCGDSRDAFYVGAGLPEYDSINRITLGDNEFLMVYGVNHVATGKATYMNANFYASETAKLTLGTIDDRKFPGTAGPYLPAGDPAADLMYAYKISRNCEGQTNCLPLSVPQGCTRLTLDSSTLLGVFTRIYLEPATKVGPAMPEILYDRVIKFSLR